MTLMNIPDQPKEIPVEAIEKCLRELGIITDAVPLAMLNAVTFGPGREIHANYRLHPSSPEIEVIRTLRITD